SSTFTTNPEHNRQKQKPTIRWVGQPTSSSVQTTISCDNSHYHYDICSINGSTALDPTTSTFYTIGPTIGPNLHPVKIKPYPRKWENSIMSKIKDVTLISSPKRPICDFHYNTSAIVFTSGGYTGNFFHDFNDGFIPLFVTVQSMSLSNWDITLVVGKSPGWWMNKYGDILQAFSVNPIVKLNNDTGIRCFRSVTVGLITHGFMTVNPHLLPNKTIIHFHDFLNKAFFKAHHKDFSRFTTRPKLVLLSRTGQVGRVILNQAQLKTMAQQVGFDVLVFEPKPNTSMNEAFGLMNESHVLLGVHGAALTHLLFLRPGSVFIQVVPIGTDEIADLCYGRPAKKMGLDYMEYKIGIDESSLVEKYSINDPILTDPNSIRGMGWALLKKVYLKEQNVKLDLVRFRKYLTKAYKKAKRFMKKYG
ncbi:hypothetical protein RND81_11G045500, partial [Saponaria officinalis]